MGLIINTYKIDSNYQEFKGKNIHKLKINYIKPLNKIIVQFTIKRIQFKTTKTKKISFIHYYLNFQ